MLKPNKVTLVFFSHYFRSSTSELPTAENNNLLSREQVIGNNVTNKLSNEPADAEGKSVIARFVAEDASEIRGLKFPHDPTESEGKIKSSKQPCKQAKAEGEIKSTDFSHNQAEAKGKIKTSRISHKQAAVDNETTEFQPTQIETKSKIITIKSSFEQAVVTDKNITLAEAEGKIKAVSTNKQTGAESKVEGTKLPCKLAITDKTTKLLDKQLEAGDEARITEIAHVHEQVAVQDTTVEFQHMLEGSEGKTTENEFQHIQSEDQGRSTRTTLPSEQAEADNKIYQIKPPYDLVASKSKTKHPCKLEETEGKTRTTELPQNQAKTEDEIITTEFLNKQKTVTDKSTSTTTTEPSHEHTTTDDKIVTTKHPHKQVETEEDRLQKTAKLLDDVVCSKRKLEKLIDEKKKRYEVDFIIEENFSVSKGKFESELQMDMVSLNQALKQKQADKDNCVQKCDELSAQIAKQNEQLKEVNYQLATAGDLKLKFENEVKRLSNTISKLREEMTAKQTRITKTNKAKKENQKCIVEVEVSLQNANKKRSQLCDKKSTTEGGLEKNDQSIEKLNETIAKTQKELEDTNATILHIKKRQNEKLSDMDKNEKSQSEHTKERDKIKSDLKEITTKCDNLKTEKTHIQSSLDRLDTEIEEVCSQKSKLQQDCESNNQKLIQLNKQLDEYRKKIEKYKGDILKLEKDTKEFQEKHNIFVLSFKVCLKLKIKEIQEKLTKGGFSCLKQLFNIWNDEIESLQKDLRQVSKKIEVHQQISMTTEYLTTSLKAIQVLQDTKLTYLECLQSTTKISYVLQATIQHCLCQINVDGFVKVIGNNCNSDDDTNQNAIIHLSTNVEIQRKKLLKIGNSINGNLFNSTKFFYDENNLLTCILEQEDLWNEMQQLLKNFAQNVIDIETQVDAKQISILFCYNHTASESGLINVSKDGEFKKAVELLNKVYCSQNLVSIVDRQLAALEKDNEKLRSLNTAGSNFLSMESKLECKESEMHQMETQKQQAQQDLYYAQERFKELTLAKYQLLKEIQEEELNLGKIIQTLHNLQQELHKKKSKMNDITTTGLQLQSIQEKLARGKIKLAEHHKQQHQLQQNLKEHQLQLQELHDVDDSTNDTKAKIITEEMHRLQEIIQTIQTNVKSYEKQLAQLDEIDRKKLELSKAVANLQEDINQHELNISHAKTFIGEIRSTLTSNTSSIENCKADEEYQKAKVCYILSLLEKKNTELNQIRETYIQCFVEMSIQKAIIGYQIEQNEQNIKMLHKHKRSLSYEETSEIKNITDKQLKFKQQLCSFEHDLQEKNLVLKIEGHTKESTQRQIQEFESNNNNISDEQKHADEKLDLKRKKRLEGQQQQKTIEMELEILHQTIQDMSQKLNNCENVLTQLNSKIQETKHEISNFLSEISNLELKVKEVTTSLNSHKSNKTSMEHKNKKLDLELKRIKDDLIKVDELISKKSSTLKDYEVTKEKFEKVHDKLQKEMEEASKTMKQSKEEKKTAQMNSEKYINEIKNFNIKNKETKDLLVKTEEDYRTRLQEKANLQKECSELENKWHDIKCIDKERVEVYSTLRKLEDQLNVVRQSKEMYNSTRSILKHILHMVEHENILEKNR